MNSNPNDNRVNWLDEDGTPLAHGIAAANGKVYYADIPVGRSCGFSVTIPHDAVDVSDFTIESTDIKSDTLELYADAVDGWADSGLGTESSAAAKGVKQFQVADSQARRWRLKRDCTTGGVSDPSFTAKGN